MRDKRAPKEVCGEAKSKHAKRLVLKFDKLTMSCWCESQGGKGAATPRV